jgi:hypothetical protein
MPPAPSENIFTDMTFSLVPPSSDGPQPGQMSHSQEIDLTDLGGSSFNMEGFNSGGNGSGPADVANMDLSGPDGEDTNMSNVDAKIDGLFELGGNEMDSMEMSFDLGPDAGDNSNFNDMYFGDGDDNMGSGEFDNNFYEI